MRILIEGLGPVTAQWQPFIIFLAILTMTLGNLAAFSHTTGALDRSWRPSAGGRVRSLAVAPGRIYLGGEFHRSGFRAVDQVQLADSI